MFQEQAFCRARQGLFIENTVTASSYQEILKISVAVD